MMITAKKLSLAWLLLLLERAPARVTNPKYILSFGDSLSDQGNTFLLTNGSEPPADTYYKGRYTNGPGNWMDHLAKWVKGSRVRSFAFGSSTACPNVKNLPGLLSAVEQVNVSYTAWLAKKPRSNNRLAVVWTGHNDITQALRELKFNAASSLAQTIPSCIKQVVETLVAHGETKIIVCTMAPLDLTPGAVSLRMSSVVAGMVNATNTALTNTIREVQQKYSTASVAGSKQGSKKVQVLLYDQNAWVRTWNRTAYGVTNFTSPCITFANSSTLHASYICPDPEAHFWYDPLHPTSTVFKYAAKDFMTFLRGINWIK